MFLQYVFIYAFLIHFYNFYYRYDAGDHVAIYPTNDPARVERIGKLLDVDLDTVFSLNNLDGMFFFISVLNEFLNLLFICYTSIYQS